MFGLLTGIVSSKVSMVSATFVSGRHREVKGHFKVGPEPIATNVPRLFLSLRA